jgi:hypothetical protein
MPPLVRLLEVNVNVAVVSPVTAAVEVDASAAHGHGHRHTIDLHLDEGDGEEVLPQLKYWRDAEEAFAEGDEGGDILNPVGIQMLQLHPVVVQ